MAIGMTVRVICRTGPPWDTRYKAVEHVPRRGDAIAIPTKDDPALIGRVEAVIWDEPKGGLNELSHVTVGVRPLPPREGQWIVDEIAAFYYSKRKAEV